MAANEFREMIVGIAIVVLSALGLLVIIPVGVMVPDGVEIRALSPDFWPFIVVAAAGLAGATLAVVLDPDEVALDDLIVDLHLHPDVPVGDEVDAGGGDVLARAEDGLRLEAHRYLVGERPALEGAIGLDVLRAFRHGASLSRTGCHCLFLRQDRRQT